MRQYTNKIFRILNYYYIIIIHFPERRKVNVLEMKCLRSLASRADQRVLRWFGHVERLDDYRDRVIIHGLGMWNINTRRVLMAEVSGGQVRGRSRLGWMDGVKMALGNRGITVEAARQCAKDQKEWRALVHM